MGAVEQLNAGQFGFAHVSVEAMRKYMLTPGSGGFKPNLPRKRVLLNRVAPSQGDIYPERVQHYVEHGWRGELPPHVVHAAGKLMVLNGHHRMAAAIQKGQKSMTVRLEDLD